MPEQADLSDRVDRLEQLVDRAIAAARQYPLGRKILAILGLS